MAQGAKTPKILFFLRGVAPEPDEQEAINRIVLPVACRNASVIHPDEGVEPCEGVAGAVPSQYDRIPRAEDLVKEHFAKLKETFARVSDDAAKGPRKPTKAERESLTKDDEKAEWGAE